MSEYIIDNYSTFKINTHVLVIQTGTAIISDEYDISVDFAWVNQDSMKANKAFLKMKMFLEDVVEQSVITHRGAHVDVHTLANNTIMLPYLPSTDVLAMTLHAKLASIVGEDILIARVKVDNKLPEFSMGFTYGDLNYDILPDMDEFADGDETFYDTPWWFRDTCETNDLFFVEGTAVTEPPEFIDVFAEIDIITDALMNNTSPNAEAEVIDFKTWTPKIIKD